MNDFPPTVLFRVTKSANTIILNRPETINSLNTQMIENIARYLEKSIGSDKCKFVLFYGYGNNGFCAGGDVKELAQKTKEKSYDDVNLFFEKEYALDLMIHNSPKPVIVIADGVTMGGGLGIAAGADIVIATERTRMAMPETKIGFFPDVGATGWLFLKCSRGYPEYLGLTGYEMQGSECVRLGLATHYVDSENIPGLISELENYEPDDNLDRQSLSSKISGKISSYMNYEIPVKKDMDAWVADYFAGKSDLKEILDSLKVCSNQQILCDAVFSGIAERSPTALVLTLKLLRYNEGRHIADVLKTEFEAAAFITKHPDYIEGVRARLIDKDDTPVWRPDKISKVDLSELKLL